MWFLYQWYLRIDDFCDEVITTHNEWIFYDFISLKLQYILHIQLIIKSQYKVKNGHFRLKAAVQKSTLEL